MTEFELEMARRHVQDGERLVEEQHARVRRLSDAREPTDAAEELLRHVQRSLAVRRAQLTQLIERGANKHIVDKQS